MYVDTNCVCLLRDKWTDVLPDTTHAVSTSLVSPLSLVQQVDQVWVLPSSGKIDGGSELMEVLRPKISAHLIYKTSGQEVPLHR